jgi:propionyl-CoA carboxylase alpha subunit
MFTKILIANRGEIALRVIQSCRRLGIRTAAVYSEADSRSRHVQEADEALCIGPARAGDSYLVKEKIIAAARDHDCQAIHPGYGFLSENAEFAEAVTRAGLAFIGPPASAISLLGDKIASKSLAVKLGIPVVPGPQEPLSDPEELLALADDLGYPVLLKPAAGGGGKGMRIAFSREELALALRLAREETRKAFGDDRIFLERFITDPRHIEIQILADQQGNVVYLGERECSIQRRYQKILEESPSPALNDSRRRELGEMSCRLAREAGYTNAGTVEFIFDGEGRFYYLEMNTRLQVEHPVTEMVTGLDLVELQLRIAAGEPLPFTQEEVQRRGWAMEARICAEDPARGFLPATGLITRYARPRGKNIRVDSGIGAGTFISAFYDSLLAKVIVWGENRQEAVQTLIRALNIYHIEGITTNIDFVNAILNHPAYQEGALSTRFIERHFKEGLPDVPPPEEQLQHMVMAATLVYHNRQNVVRDSLKPLGPQVGVTHAPKVFYDYVVKAEKDVFRIRLEGDPAGRRWNIRVNDRSYEVVTPEFEYYRRRLKLKIDGQYHYFRLQYRGNYFWAAFCGIARILEIYSPREWALARYMPAPKTADTAHVLVCPMPGLVVDIRVNPGDPVFRGQDLVSIESMKMESYVASPCDGVVAEVKVNPGQAVETGDVLVTFQT